MAYLQKYTHIKTCGSKHMKYNARFWYIICLIKQTYVKIQSYLFFRLQNILCLIKQCCMDTKKAKRIHNILCNASVGIPNPLPFSELYITAPLSINLHFRIRITDSNVLLLLNNKFTHTDTHTHISTLIIGSLI